jgi:hypothetical protein
MIKPKEERVMMMHEFQERVGDFPIWQWPAIEVVYRDHKDIPDIGGKDVIASWYKDKGFEGIFKEFVALGNNPRSVIRESREDTYSRYDVTYEGYVVNETAKTINEVCLWAVDELKTKYPDIYEQLDYFHKNYRYDGTDKKDEKWPLEYNWLSVFYVRGESEGFYFHVEAIEGDKRTLLLLGKTLSWSRDVAEKIQNTLARIFQV